MNKEKIVEIICEAICDSHGYNDALGMANCVFDRLEKSGFLLKSAHGSNHKDFAHCANTRLGDSAASVETSTVEEPAGEILSETASVRQNEVAKEVCQHCKSTFIGYNAAHTEYRCGFCGIIGKPIDNARRAEG